MPATQTEYVSRSSADFPAFNPARCEEVQRRHGLLAEFMHLQGADALLLQRPANMAWLTCGGDVLRAGSCQPTATVFLTRDARLVLTNNVDSAWLFDGPLNGLGLQVKERPWHEGREQLCVDLCRGRTVVTDLPGGELPSLDRELSQFRTRLNQHEEPLLRDLARDVTHAVEATCRTCREGTAESEMAGQVMHRLAHHQVAPVRVQVVSDGRGERYRHYGYTDAPIRGFATVAAVGRRNGLHVGCARTFAFGTPSERLQQSHYHASLLLGAAFYFSQTGWSIDDTWTRLQRIYEKFGAVDEWRLADQGEITGYEACEQIVAPGVKALLQTGQPVHWHPSVGPAVVGDTVLVQAEGQACLTRSIQWPMLTVSVKGTPIELPGILIRDQHEEWAIG
ncbi:MAG: M24 family metallopeptidase [Planctomycetaceae bacterium]